MKKYWYAAQSDPTDEWGTGSFDLDEAKEMARQLGPDALVAVIDGGYDDEGNATTDPVCISEIRLADF